MKKYLVKTYHEYVATTIVYADSPQEALEKGLKVNINMPKENLDFIDITDTEVIDENFEVVLTQEK